MSNPVLVDDMDGNLWDITKLVAKPDMNPKNLHPGILGFKSSDLDAVEYVTADNAKDYKKIPLLGELYTDGKEIWKAQHLFRTVRYHDKVTDEFRCCERVKSGKRYWRHMYHFETKERIYNGKPTMYWVSSTGIMIPKAVITATAFIGPKPVGHTLQFVDGDYQNTNPENLRWTLKTKPDGSVRYVSYDKTKKRFRLTHPTLPRKVFKSQEEAVAYLKSQQVEVQYVNNDDNNSVDPVIIMPADDSTDEEPETIHL
jgi:hypothetical protein